MKTLPFFTNTPGVGGTIKNSVDDFCVEEKLKYPCSGYGDFLYVEIEKQNITTFEVIRLLCRNLQIKRNDIGYAGIKDSYARTKQYFSLFKIKESDLSKIDIPNVKICKTLLHHKKLKLGNIAENYFSIIIQDPNKDHLIAQETMDILEKRGVPNFYGQQRFGSHGNTHLAGKYLLLEENDKLVETLFSISDVDNPKVQQFKSYFHEGKYQEAYENTPAKFETEKIILSFLARGKNLKVSLNAIPRKIKYFYICAYQSYLFNLCLSNRLDKIDVVFDGDLAMLHPTHSVFLVENSEIEQPRCASQKISPSGALFGHKMIQPNGEQLKIEKEILELEQVNTDLFHNYKMPGERRSLRFFVKEPIISQHNNNIKLQFSLSSGCYATTVLREIMKSDFFLTDS